MTNIEELKQTFDNLELDYKQLDYNNDCYSISLDVFEEHINFIFLKNDGRYLAMSKTK